MGVLMNIYLEKEKDLSKTQFDMCRVYVYVL